MIPVPLIVFRVVCPAETGAQAKVCQFYVSISIDQNIVWFNVAVNETHFMNTLHCAHQLRNIESMDEKKNRITIPGSILRDAFCFVKMNLHG